jgi:peptidoglycan/LPS O-acetylase OafA/YrhL
MGDRESVRAEVGHIAPVEGLRGVAVILVVLFHYVIVLEARFADPWIAAIDSALATRVVARNGMLGVDLFFLISGFLLVLPWLRHREEGLEPPSARGFYRRRVERIVPAYYVHLLILFFVLVPLLRGLEFWRHNPAYMFQNLSAHVFFAHYLSPVTSASVGVNGSLWTLTLEAQFYLVLPLVAPLFARAPWRTAAVLFAIALAWRGAAAMHMDGLVHWIRSIEPSWKISEASARHLLYTQFPAYLAHFAAGMLAARAWLRWRQRAPTQRVEVAWLAAAAAALAVLWLLHSPGGWILGEPTWVVALAALAIAFTAFAARGLAASKPLLANPPLAFVGRVSYSVYLYHLPVLLLWNAYAPPIAGSWLVLPLYVAAVLAVSWMSYRYVENDKRGQTPIRRPEMRTEARIGI